MYTRLFVTPEYENILFSTSAEAAALVPPAVKESRELGGGVLFPHSERQNAYTVGVQQAIGGRLRLDVDFWWRRSTFPGDQDQFENTGIVFPLSFPSGKFNGWGLPPHPAATPRLTGVGVTGHPP